MKLPFLGEASPTTVQNLISPAIIKGQLEKFYNQPVARVSAELVLSIVTVIGFGVFALSPTLTTMSKLVKEIEDKRKLEDGLTKKIAALSTAQNEYLSYQKRFDVLETAYQRTLTLEDLLFYLEYLASQQKISLASLRIDSFPVELLPEGAASPTPTPKGAAKASTTKASPAPAAKATPPKLGIRHHVVQVSIKGHYAEIRAFLRTVESIRPLFSLQGFSLQKNEETNQKTNNKDPVDPDLMNANMTLHIYSYGEILEEKKE